MGTPKQTLRKRPVTTAATQETKERSMPEINDVRLQPSTSSWKPQNDAPQRWPKRRSRQNSIKYKMETGELTTALPKGSTSNRSKKYKRELCHTWTETGSCPYGLRCQYAHGEAELRVEEADKPSAYKTVRCRNFWEKGSCPYGKRCRFVHDEAVGFDDDKAQRVKRHPKYKTKICTTFTETGRCPYGDRCAFIHKRKEDSDVNDICPLAGAVGAENSAINQFVTGFPLSSTGGTFDQNLMPPQAIHERSASQTFEQEHFSLYIKPYLPTAQTHVSVEQVALMSTDPNGTAPILGGDTGIPLARRSTTEFENQSRLLTWMN